MVCKFNVDFYCKCNIKMLIVDLPFKGRYNLSYSFLENFLCSIIVPYTIFICFNSLGSISQNVLGLFFVSSTWFVSNSANLPFVIDEYFIPCQLGQSSILHSVQMGPPVITNLIVCRINIQFPDILNMIVKYSLYQAFTVIKILETYGYGYNMG